MGKKGTSHIRKIWKHQNLANIPIGQQKWITDLNLTENEDWKYLCNLAKNCKLYASTIFFQYQMLHRTIMTDRKLCQFNLRPNELCDDCQVPEDISHLFFNCPEANIVWTRVQTWLIDNTNMNINFNKKAILLGDKNNETVINTIILITKHEIYKKKWKARFLNLNYLKNLFKNQMNIEIYIGTINNRLPKVLGKWSSLYNVLRN